VGEIGLKLAGKKQKSVFEYCLSTVEILPSVQVSDTTMLNNDKMIANKNINQHVFKFQIFKLKIC